LTCGLGNAILPQASVARIERCGSALEELRER